MKKRIKLSDVTTYKFGGFCNSFYELSDKSELSEIESNLTSEETFVLGKGSNVAFSDKEFKGTVLRTNFNKLKYFKDKSEVKVGSGYYLPKLSRFYKTNNLGNCEFLLGIPGSVGGAVKMNAGAHGLEFSDVLLSLEVFNLESKKFERLSKKEVAFSYRNTKNLENKIITSVTLSAVEEDPVIIKKKMRDYTTYRKNTQPAGIYNAGSVFKNTEDYSAGQLIDNAGLKGYSVDGVSVSNKHANFFIAPKGSKAKSLYILVKYVKDQVNKKYGVDLEEEILFIGDFD
tara:strand:+ start:3619 stop:4476 length:858 start_codon:yes stop_codon:yes gene_type:complete